MAGCWHRSGCCCRGRAIAKRRRDKRRLAWPFTRRSGCHSLRGGSERSAALRVGHARLLGVGEESHAERRPTEMTLEDARQRVVEAGYRIKKEVRLGNNTGTRLRLDRGAVVDVYDNGNHSCQGKNCQSLEALLDRVPAAKELKPAN